MHMKTQKSEIKRDIKSLIWTPPIAQAFFTLS